MAILTVYPDPDAEITSVDGFVGRTGVSESWATIIAGAGNTSSDNAPTGNFIAAGATGTSNLWESLIRSIFLFDTSALGASASISAAVLSLTGTSKLDPSGLAPNIDIYTSTPASNTALANADYSQLGSTSQTGSPISYTSYSTTGYNDFTFNATGIGNISKTGVSKFGARNANYDVAGTAPTWSAGTAFRLQGIYADTAGTSTDPKLVITYTTARIRDVIMHGGVVVRKR